MMMMMTIIMMMMMTMAPVQCVKGFRINGAHDRKSSGVWFAPPELKSFSRWIFSRIFRKLYIYNFYFFSFCSPDTEIIISLSLLSCHHHGIIEFLGHLEII